MEMLESSFLNQFYLNQKRIVLHSSTDLKLVACSGLVDG